MSHSSTSVKGQTLLTDRNGIAIALQPASAPVMTTSLATFPIDPDEILRIAAEDLCRQLLPWAQTVLSGRIASVDGDANSVFLDELDNSICLEGGCVRFEVEPPYDSIVAVYEPYTDEDEVRRYASPIASDEAVAQETLQEWLCGLI